MKIDQLIPVTLVAYVGRDCAATLIQFLLNSLGLDFLWYVPDALGLVSVAFLLGISSTRSHTIFFTLIPMAIFYFCVGLYVSESIASSLSALKMCLPLSAGLILRANYLSVRWVRLALFSMLLISVIGIIFTYFSPLPYADLHFEGLDRTRTLQSDMFMYGERRPRGFAGDQHGAGFSIVAVTFLLSLNQSFRMTLILICLELPVIFITTSRSSLLAAIVFYIIIFIHRKRAVFSAAVVVSCYLVLTPVMLSVVFSNIPLNDVPYEIRSLATRVAESWYLPFSYMGVLSPLAWLHGYGLGGVGYPLLLSSQPSYYVPVDNFFIGSYLIMGVIYVPVYVLSCLNVIYNSDFPRRCAFVVCTVFGQFIWGFGNSNFLILYGFAVGGFLHMKTSKASRPAG